MQSGLRKCNCQTQHSGKYCRNQLLYNGAQVEPRQLSLAVTHPHPELHSWSPQGKALSLLLFRLHSSKCRSKNRSIKNMLANSLSSELADKSLIREEPA